MKTLLTLLIAITGLAPALAAQDGPPDRIHWVGDWKTAVKLAKETRRPLMIHFNMDDEPACQGMARTHFRNKDLIALSRKFVCVVGSLGEHEGEKIFTDGDHCHRFGSVTCAEHRVIETFARGEVLAVKTVTAPQFVFAAPDLTVITRKAWDTSPREIMALMKRTLAYYNPDMTPAEVRTKRRELIKALLRDAASDNAATRTKALEALATRDDPEVIEFLLKQTSGDVDEVKRNEAIKAIGEAGNANCLPTLVKLLRDRSVQIRRNTVVALYRLGMVEAVPNLMKSFGVESNDRNQALILRTCSSCSREDEDVHKLIVKSLKAPRPLVRRHAIRALLDLDVTPKDLARLTGLTKDTNTEVRAVACHAATSTTIRARDGKDDDVSAFAKLEKRRVRPSLRTVARGDREEDLRTYAAQCLAALDGMENEFEDLERFHDDEAIFEEGDEAQKSGRGGGGRGGR